MEKKNQKEKMNEQCTDKYCSIHRRISLRGRKFKGFVKKIIGRRAAIEWDRTRFYPKFERFSKSKSRIHAHIPQCLEIKEGDNVYAVECRPLSTILHFVIIGKVNKK